MKNKIFLIILGITILVSCKKVESDLDLLTNPIAYQNAIDSIYNLNPNSVGIMVHIESPKNKLSWSGCSGFSNKKQKIELSPDQPALIASSIKTYISATILRLEELGMLSIEESISKYLSKETIQLFENDGYEFDNIKLKHLLSHTSGIKDYADKEYLEWIDKNQKHRWTRNEQLNLTVEKGDPLGEPEEVFSYADANYLLCTEIIELISKKPFYTSIRELLYYQELGFTDTWFPTLEEANTETKDLVHQYWGEKNWDSYEQDISWDLYGGGGIATTTKELAQFSYNLFQGKIIKDTTILNKIYTNVIPSDGKDVGYRLGLVEGTTNGLTYFGHGGFWGTTVLYLPALETSIAIYVLDRDKGALRADLTNTLVNILGQQLSIFEKKVTSEYELHKLNNSEATLILFPGGANTAEEIRREFKIVEKARQHGISTLLMNFNRHLWIDSSQSKNLAQKLESIFKENNLSTNNIHIGGMSIGGNVTLSLSNYLHKFNSDIAPKGLFIVDSPIDLYALYESSVADIKNPNLSEERLSEPRGIIDYLESKFGQKEALLKNIEKVSPFTLLNKSIGIDSLKNIKIRFYTEPDKQWYMENRQTEFQYTNAYTIRQASKLLQEELHWENIELIETTNKGYRSNGERNPHSWSIVEIEDLIKWIKE